MLMGLFPISFKYLYSGGKTSENDASLFSSIEVFSVILCHGELQMWCSYLIENQI